MRISHNAVHAGFTEGLKKEHRQHFRADLRIGCGAKGDAKLYQQDTDRGDTHSLAFVCSVGTTSA